MSSQKRVKYSQAQKRTSQVSNSYQTNLLAGEEKEDLNDSKHSLKHGQDNPAEDYGHADDQGEDALQIAVRYFEKGKTDNFLFESSISVKMSSTFSYGFLKESIFLLIHAFVYLIGIY